MIIHIVNKFRSCLTTQKFWLHHHDARATWEERITAVIKQIKVPTAVICDRRQQEKKISYYQICMEVENGSFTPLVFGRECSMFLATLATLAEKLSVVRAIMST